MRETHPLPDHPEFSVRDYPGYREYRVENFYVARNGSGRIIQKATGLSWRCALFPVLFSLTRVNIRAFLLHLRSWLTDDRGRLSGFGGLHFRYSLQLFGFI